MTYGLRLFQLALVVLVPALMVLACALYVRRRRRVAARLGERHLVGRIAGRDLHPVPRQRVVPMLLAALALGLAAADPRWGAATGVADGAARDVVLVLDASNSMLVEDVRPSRLDQQRQVAQRLVASLPNDRIGVIAFAGEASVLAPPTRDHDAVAMYIEAVHPGIAVQTGSALSAGLRQASSLLAAGPERRGARIVVLLSDGEAQEPEAELSAALQASRSAAALGVTIHAGGIGTPTGGPVPDMDPETGARRGYKTDPRTGETAVSFRDEAVLREVARETGGAFIALESAGALDALIARIGTVEATGGTPPRGSERAPRYAWFVAVALILLAGDAVAERRRQRPA